MLQLNKITKEYKTEGFSQKALDEVSICFRKNEFASILGPSGSGKTTLLNIIGGLDKYDNGEMIINEVSTKNYKDRDWDAYRNHRIGFVFQSYNLIPHQSVLSNVELALTLSGVSKSQRRKKAKAALTKVGLAKHIYKKPSQLSGGQMQRVAIARALVNDPDILLADEPTGALDSETSIQIMEIIKEIAQEKLVIMVTHNPELAEKYSTRIIKLKDGHIIDDSNSYDGADDTKNDYEEEKKKSKKTSMSLKTALSLSFNNLKTKKGRTILTAFAGSIGIIGIALILSLSNGVQEYIDRVEKETLSGYPLTIESSGLDMSSMIANMRNDDDNVKECDSNKICTIDDLSKNPYLTMSSSMISNNLKDFKKYLDNNGGNINKYITSIQYVYDLDLQIYSKNTKGDILKINPYSSNNMAMFSSMNVSDDMTTSLLTNSFRELIENDELLSSQYEIINGNMPKEYNEIVLVVDENNTIPLSVMYSLDIENRDELTELINKAQNNEEYVVPNKTYDYNELMNINYKLILNSDYYKKDNGIWLDKSNESSYLEKLYNNGIDIKIVGIIKVKEDATNATSGFIGYKHSLVDYVIDKINNSAIAKEQIENKNINVFTGVNFDGITSTYEDNLSKIGINDLDNPKAINIYPKDFDSKEEIKNIINDYNNEVKEEDEIQYTDMIGTLMSGVTTIINVISYVLIAFVAISLIVSSIMIAIITYISVLERTKEIGILRAIGASKKDVTRVFNAETIIEGLVSGIMGIAITLLLCVPINYIVNNLFDINKIASLPLYGAITLIIISVLLTVIAGLFPSRMASKKDPVEALRSE